MKKIVLIGVMVLLSVLLITATVACTDAKKGFTDPDLIKVDKAFNGVEQSMSEDTARNAASVRTAAFSGLKMAAMTESDALTAIRNVYESGDRQADALPEFSYDEPPMQQFRYLKAVFEEMGDDYRLGTKYYYDISGTIYFDMQTGFPVATKTAEYQYDYVFGFSMSIDLKENDLIFAEVGFKIHLTHGDREYNTSWYVCFDLDYDFVSNDPTYTLTMYTDNQEKDLPYLHRDQGYELDYVNMKNGAIKEWRKFSMDASKEIFIDETHDSFEDYVAEGIVYDAGTSKWYDNRGYYKITRLTDEKNLALATAFVDGLGMNGTAINAAAFLNKEGTVNPVIDTYYKKICSVRDGDILYDLVCKKEDKERETGGNGNGEASGANWESATENMNIPDVVPAFLTASGTFSAEYDRESNAWLISYENLGENDIQNYCETLEAAGFIHETRSNYYFVDEENDQVVLVAVTEIDGAIVIATADAANSIVNVPYGLSFHGDVSGQNVTQITDTKSISDVDVLSQGFVTTSKLDALILGENKSCVVDITIAYGENIDATAEDYAQNAAKAYGALYMNDADWTKNNDNTLCYKTLTSFDVIIIISHKVESGDPHVVIYVLLVPQGTAERIVSGDAGGESGRPDGGESGGEIGGNGGEGENGEGEGEGGNGEPQVTTVNVNFIYLDSHKEILHDNPQVMENGAPIDLNAVLTEPKQGAYYNKECTRKITSSVSAYEGLRIYIWADDGEEQAQQATLTVYDVTEEGTVLYAELKGSGSGDYFGYSFQYLLYWDEGCSDPIDLDYDFDLSEGDVTVYRHIYEDYFALHIKTYINGHLYETSSAAYRKEKIYNAFGSSGVGIVNDYYDSYFAIGEYGSVEFYLGDGKETALTEAGFIAASQKENDVIVSVFVTNPEHHVYTVKVGDNVLTEDYVVTFGSLSSGLHEEIFGYKNKSAASYTVAGNTITMHDVTTLKGPVRQYLVWDGRIICQDTGFGDTYFADNFTYNGDIGYSENFFLDVNCNNAMPLTDNGYGTGEYVITGARDVYSPINPRYIP